MCIRKVPVLICLAYMLLLLACVACTLGFVAPFWLVFPEDPVNGVRRANSDGIEWTDGLWATCVRNDRRCYWFWEDDFAIERRFPIYHKVSQGLYAGGLLLLYIVQFALSPYVCCRACRGSLTISPVMGTLGFGSIICITASLAVYGAFAAKEDGARVIGYDDYPTFYWGYYVGVAGLVSAFAASIMLFCESCQGHRRAGYRPASQVV